MVTVIHNTQAPEQRLSAVDGTNLDVHSIFDTIQGEGPHAGTPAIFIRLAGCNIQCPGCDTEYTATRATMLIIDVLQQVKDIAIPRPSPLVVITGGEPFRQNISLLCNYLIGAGYRVQIETNGILPPALGFPARAEVVCSPKGSKVSDKLMFYIRAYKYVLEAGDADADGLPLSTLGNKKIRPARPHAGFQGPIFISPMDSGDPGQNQRNIAEAVRSCMKHGYRLNLQIHKLVGLP